MALQTHTEGDTLSSPPKRVGGEAYSDKKIPPALWYFTSAPHFSLK